MQEDFDEESSTESKEEDTPTKDESMMPPYPEDTRQLIDVADLARKEFTEAETNFNEVDKQIQ